VDWLHSKKKNLVHNANQDWRYA